MDDIFSHGTIVRKGTKEIYAVGRMESMAIFGSHICMRKKIVRNIMEKKEGKKILKCIEICCKPFPSYSDQLMYYCII